MMDKDTLRKEKLAYRESLSPEQIHELSYAIQSRLISSPIWTNKEHIGLYSPVRGEVDTQLILMTALSQGKHVFFPRVEQGIELYEVDSPQQLQKGAWGIPEPDSTCLALGERELDLLIMPGIAFGRKGGRIGYGKGFYDRLLEKISPPAIALAYSHQVVDEIQVDVWDRHVRWIVTENQLIDCQKERDGAGS